MAVADETSGTTLGGPIGWPIRRVYFVAKPLARLRGHEGRIFASDIPEGNR
jgi:hypothetical protein